MATFDQPSELVYRIAYPSVRRLGLRTDPRIASLPAQGEKQLPVPSSQQGIEEGSLFREIESGAKLKRNPWAGAGALALQSLILLAVVVVPLFHTDPLPKRQTLTMLYLQPFPITAGSAMKLQVPKLRLRPHTSATSTGLSAPVHK